MDFRRNDFRSAALAALALAAVAGLSLPGDAAAQARGMTLNVEAADGASSFEVSGQTADTSRDITVLVTSPNNNVVYAGQISPASDGSYMTEIRIGGTLGSQDGTYTIAVQQDESPLYRLSVQAEIANGLAAATSVSESSLERDGGSVLTPGADDSRDASLVMEVDAPEGSMVISVSGTTDNSMDVAIIVTAPNNNVVQVAQVTPSNGQFSTVINTGCASWSQDGFYTITAQQGSNNLYRASEQVEIADCAVIPEFGAVAALVLAVAIVSIVAVTARSRLSIVPRL